MRRQWALVGMIGGLLWVGLACFPPVGVRVSRTYEILWNRLWTPALLGMGLGFVGLFQTLHPVLSRAATNGLIAMLIGFALMIGGNVTEYWLFSALPHEGPAGFMRTVAWLTVLAAALLTLAAITVTGVAMRHTNGLPRWLSLLFLLPLPLTLVIGVVSLNWAGTPIGFLSIIVGSRGLRPLLTPAGTAHTPEARAE